MKLGFPAPNKTVTWLLVVMMMAGRVTDHWIPPANCNPDSAEINYQLSDHRHEVSDLLNLSSSPLCIICFMAERLDTSS